MEYTIKNISIYIPIHPLPDPLQPCIKYYGVIIRLSISNIYRNLWGDRSCFTPKFAEPFRRFEFQYQTIPNIRNLKFVRAHETPYSVYINNNKI